MKSRMLFLIILFLGIAAYGSTQMIVCGTEPGEIYFAGPIQSLWDFTGFYYSRNSGETIELRDSTTDPSAFIALLADVADSTLYRRCDYASLMYLTTNGGFVWNAVDTTAEVDYASGVISGEIYRIRTMFTLERSTDYGYHYTACTCAGGPSSLGIHSVALGSDSGEVYILGDFGKLFHSNDFAESFTLLVDLYDLYGIPPLSYLLNGQQPGEVYVFHNDSQRIWRITNYGSQVELIANFNYLCWFYSVAVSRFPGELYFMAAYTEMIGGGYVHIYHTLDYFQTYTMYEHIVEPQGVNSPKTNVIPTTINLTIYPNPTNAVFNLFYQLDTTQDAKLIMCNIIGRTVWQYDPGIQSPGIYQLHFSNNEMPSGIYFMHLLSSMSNITIPIIVIK